MSLFTSVRLEITSKCNLNCKYCHNLDFANKNNDMTTEKIKALLISLKKELGVNKVLLTGGEPLLNSDVVEIVQLLTDLKIKSDLVTNGKLLTEKMINNLSKAGLKRIRISIDGVGDEHNKYRIGSNVEELWEKCKYIKNNTKINTVVHTVSSMHNANKMFDIYKKILEVKADRWRIFDVGYEGAANQNIKELDVSTYYHEFMDQMSRTLRHYIEHSLINKLDIEANGVFKTNLLTKPPMLNTYEEKNKYFKKILNLSPCAYIQHQSTIRSDGKGTLCQFFS
ncbi:radical SAM protein [Bulleidia sp. zg-1006]|uniref:radical SAM protein n=1 Tax=Bulleidia sp. zg-1006 TaxID=2806552 RepID=UPI00193A8AB8|nr:radical SAM protein [Bulleidia sp. zg-1006]QRG87216.1 radical SAM protein [Bulleidia sp. zg-1006]